MGSQYISKKRDFKPISIDNFVSISKEVIEEVIKVIQVLKNSNAINLSALELRTKYQIEMDKCAGYIRNINLINEQIDKCKLYLKTFYTDVSIDNVKDIVDVFINEDILITSLIYLNAMKSYIEDGGDSRGSYIIDRGDIDFNNIKSKGIVLKLDNGKRKDIVQDVELVYDNVLVYNILRKPIPDDDSWFENVYNRYLSGDIVH